MCSAELVGRQKQVAGEENWVGTAEIVTTSHCCGWGEAGQYLVECRQQLRFVLFYSYKLFSASHLKQDRFNTEETCQ